MRQNARCALFEGTKVGTLQRIQSEGTRMAVSSLSTRPVMRRAAFHITRTFQSAFRCACQSNRPYLLSCTSVPVCIVTGV